MSAKKVGLVFLVLLGGAVIVGLVSTGLSARHHGKLTEDYFRTLFTGGPEDLQAFQHAEWPNGEVVPPLLRFTQERLRENLGAYIRVEQAESIKKVGSDRPWTVKCVLRFEKGTGNGTLFVKDDLVVDYHVFFPQLPKGMSFIPEDKSY